MSSEVFTQILLAVISIAGALVSAYLVPYLKSKFTSEQLDNLAYYITVAVRCAEQIYTPEQWQEKKQYVVDYAKNIVANHVKIDLSDDQLDAIIEGIVNEVKKGGSND